MCNTIKPYGMGMQVSHSMDTEISEEGNVRGIAEAFRRSAPSIGKAEGKRDYRRSPDDGSCTHIDIDPTEVFGIASGGVYQGQECHTYCQELYRAEEEFYRSAFLGEGILCDDSGC